MSVFSQYDVSLHNADCAEADYFICGTEYEIESVQHVNIPNYNVGSDEPFWMGDIGAVKDGSLRNNGIEFVTRPMNYEKSLAIFTELRSRLSLGENPYSARTSTHVHVNVSSLSLDQLKHFVLLYALFEPVFFKFAGDARKHNIHCVPLGHTLLPSNYSKSITSLVDNWSKYSAFNLKPVKTIGTVEFRHLYGTGDIKVYQQWLSMLKDLWEFAYNKPSSWLRHRMMAGMSPLEMLPMVIPSAPGVYTAEDFADSVIDVKLAFVGN